MKHTVKALVCVLVAVFILCPQLVYAEVYYPPTIYVRPDPSYQTGQAIGSILGALIQRSQLESAEREREKAEREFQENKRKIQQYFDTTTRQETADIVKAISNMGLEATWNAMSNLGYDKGLTPYKNVSNGIATISITENLDGGLQIFREYSINLNTQQCRCVLRLSPIGVESVYVEPFYLSQIDSSPTKTVGNYLGLVASAEKTKEGGFAILDVVPGGLSEFAGIKKGDILIKVDTYNVKDFDIERVAAYVEQRTKQKAVVKATVLRDGQSIIIEMQL
jgi:hypothetical protein